jgi:hypothetical protein
MLPTHNAHSTWCVACIICIIQHRKQDLAYYAENIEIINVSQLLGWFFDNKVRIYEIAYLTVIYARCVRVNLEDIVTETPQIFSSSTCGYVRTCEFLRRSHLAHTKYSLNSSSHKSYLRRPTCKSGDTPPTLRGGQVHHMNLNLMHIAAVSVS